MFIIKIADIKIAIDNKYDFVNKICKKYTVVSNEYDFKVCVSHDEIENEKSLYNNNHSDGFIESVCVYRKIAEELPRFDAFVLHCAAIEYENKAYCFTAKSGVGKTTHIKLWRNMLGNKVLPINGDKPIIRIFGDDIFVCGTPWSGKEMYNRNVMVPLGALCEIQRSKDNSINELPLYDGLKTIMQHLFIPSDTFSVEKTVKLVGCILQSTKYYKLKCDISINAAETSFNAMYK